MSLRGRPSLTVLSTERRRHSVGEAQAKPFAGELFASRRVHALGRSGSIAGWACARPPITGERCGGRRVRPSAP
jgi:hypothetical protein